VDTRALVREAAELLDRPATFTIEVADDMPVIVTEKVPFAEVIRNLINNAIKHRERDDGRVTVTCRTAGDFVEVSVADDGPGIDETFHEQIFHMFETLRPRDHVEASGMGLALVKKIVEKNGGTIHVESSPGSGATFHFTWPKTVQ
jgi:signal transduction histidine kinase